jgi:hypothetical protein
MGRRGCEGEGEGDGMKGDGKARRARFDAISTCTVSHAAVLAVIMHGLVCVLSEPACNRLEEVDGDDDAVAVAVAVTLQL